MDNQLKSKQFQFDNYKVDYINFNLNPDFKYVEPIDVDFKLNVKINIADDNKNGNVYLKADIFENAEDKNYPFSLHVRID